VLGVESSCDEMAAAVVRGAREILSSVVHGQAALHRPYGGVVPELASRDHARCVSSVVAEALERAGVAAEGASGSSGSASGRRSPTGSVCRWSASTIWQPPRRRRAGRSRPDTAVRRLVISGGRTRLPHRGRRALAARRRATTPSAKPRQGGRLLGLPSGSPAIGRAAGAASARIEFRARCGEPGLDFFSGLKTAVALEVERRGTLGPQDVADVAASFEAAAVDVLVSRSRRALREQALARLAVVGGSPRMRRLRARLARRRATTASTSPCRRLRSAPTTQ
jgi:N6-L-threonylcarbamoyladenine synthase